MTRQSRLAVAAARNLGPCTIWVHEPEYHLVDAHLKAIADVRTYRSNPAILLPWASTPKWQVEPEADVVLGCDADVFVWNEEQVVKAAQLCLAKQALCGTMAYWYPFEEAEWPRLFQLYGLAPDFNYRYQTVRQSTPFYINNGAVMLPSTMLPAFRESFYRWLPEINARYLHNYFMVQVATTIAIYKAGLKTKVMPRTFNYTDGNNPGLPGLDQVAFLHCTKHRDQLQCHPVPAVAARIRELLPVELP